MEKRPLKIEPRTTEFIEALEYLKTHGKKLSNGQLASIMGIKTLSTISEIKGKRQNIQPDQWEKFKEHFHSDLSEFSEIKTSERPEDFFGTTDVSMLAFKAALKAIVEKLIETEALRTKKAKKDIRLEFHKAMRSEYNQLLDELRNQPQL